MTNIFASYSKLCDIKEMESVYGHQIVKQSEEDICKCAIFRNFIKQNLSNPSKHNEGEKNDNKYFD